MEAGGATLRDGTHELYIYKCEDRARLESSSYLQLPSSARDTSVHISSTSSSAGAFSRSSKESVYIHTLLCSTKLTQNGKPFMHQLCTGILFRQFLLKIKAFHKESITTCCTVHCNKLVLILCASNIVAWKMFDI